MKNKKIGTEGTTDGRMKMPYWARSFIYCYIGWVGILISKRAMNEDYILIKVVSLVSLSIMTVVFAYGIICLIIDIKKGGISRVLKKIQRAINGKF